MRESRGLVLLALLAFSACLASCASSPPMRLYTLSPVGNGSNENTAPAIRVARVTLPGEIDRPEIVQRIDANRLQLAEQDRWAAPLGEMIQRTLSADLQSRVPGGGAPAAGVPGVAGETESLSVDIEEFIGGADCAISLRAAWSLQRSNADKTMVRGYETVRIEAPGACQVSALPQAMSRALAEFSSRVLLARAKQK